MGKNILVTRDGWRVLTRLNINGFTIYTNVKSSCCTPETNTKLDVNYISKKKKKFKAMSPVEQQRAQERMQGGLGSGALSSQKSPLDKIPKAHLHQSQILSHFSSKPQPQKSRRAENKDSGFRLPIWIPALPLPCCASLNKLLNLSVVPFPHPCFIRLSWGLHEWMVVKHLTVPRAWIVSVK